MDDLLKILVVEDEMIIAANISLDLTNLGYEVTAIVPRGEEAIWHIKTNPPDLVLLDIQLKGEMDGIEVAQVIQNTYQIPVIFLTANADDYHFERAKPTKPFAFISKPYKRLDLQRAIELAIASYQEIDLETGLVDGESADSSAFVLTDAIFVKSNDKIRKLFIEDILYIEAERNYSRIYTINQKEHLIVLTLKDFDQRLPAKHFLRIHRSFIVNISKVHEIGKAHVVIAKKAIPLSKNLRTELLNRLQTI